MKYERWTTIYLLGNNPTINRVYLKMRCDEIKEIADILINLDGLRTHDPLCIPHESNHDWLGTGEYLAYSNFGVTKEILAFHCHRLLPETIDETILHGGKIKAPMRVIPPLAMANLRMAAASGLANRILFRIGRDFAADKNVSLAKKAHTAINLFERGGQTGEIRFDLKRVEMANRSIASTRIETIRGLPFRFWLQTPITPVLTNYPGYLDNEKIINPDEKIQRTAHSIFLLLRSGKIRPSGKNVDIDQCERMKIINNLCDAIRRNSPIIIELFYAIRGFGSLSRGNQINPGIQDWYFSHWLTRIAKTVECMYPPGVKWLLQNESFLFANEWSYDRTEATEYLRRFEDMLSIMGARDYFLISDAEDLLNAMNLTIKNKIARIRKDLENLHLNIHELGGAKHFSEPNGLNGELSSNKSRRTISLENAFLRLIDPLRYFDDITVEELLYIYKDNIRIIDTRMEQPTARAPFMRRIIHDLSAYALEIYMTFMSNRCSLKNASPSHVLKASVTDKPGKLCFHACGRNQLLPGHGLGLIRYKTCSSFGSTEVTRTRIEVRRAIEIYSAVTGNTNRSPFKMVLPSDGGEGYYIQDLPTSV